MQSQLLHIYTHRQTPHCIFDPIYDIATYADKRKKIHEKMYINNAVPAAYASVSLTVLPACALQFMKIKYMHKMDDDITNKKCINIDLPNNERVDFDLFLLCG